jgi:hypothetical protein
MASFRQNRKMVGSDRPAASDAVEQWAPAIHLNASGDSRTYHEHVFRQTLRGFGRVST